MGAKASDADPGLYVHSTKEATVFLLIWVDDILLASSSHSAIDSAKKALMTAFDARDLGEAKFFVGLSIERKRTNRSIKLAQKLAITDLVHKFGKIMVLCMNPATVQMSRRDMQMQILQETLTPAVRLPVTSSLCAGEPSPGLHVYSPQ
jgi:hypothetical protein